MKAKKEEENERTLNLSDRHYVPFVEACSFALEISDIQLNHESVMRFWLGSADHWSVSEEVAKAVERVRTGACEDENSYKDLNVLKIMVQNV